MTRYKNEIGQVLAQDGTAVTLVVQHVDIDPKLARTIFDWGQETGVWGWKQKVWYCATIQALEVTQAAARFFYGWKSGSETVSKAPQGGYYFKATYAC